MKPKIPKDLGLKIGYPLEVLWTTVKKNFEEEIKIMEDTLLVNKEFLKVAEKMIIEEQKKSKSLNT